MSECYKVKVLVTSNDYRRPYLIKVNGQIPLVLVNLWIGNVYSKGMKPKFNTAKAYLDDVKVFYEWMSIRKNNIMHRISNFNSFKKNEIKNLMEFIKIKKNGGLVSPSTFNRRIISILSYVDFCMDIVIENNRSNLEKFSASIKQKERFAQYIKKYLCTSTEVENSTNITTSLSNEKIEKLVEGLTSNDFNGFRNDAIRCRNACMIIMAYECWLRRSELVLIELHDIEFSAGNAYLTIKEKKGKILNDRNDGASFKTIGRVLPLSQKMTYMLNIYIDEIRHKFVNLDNPTTALFLSELDGKRLSAESFSRIVTSLEKYFPFLKGERMHAHKLRATGATVFREKNSFNDSGGLNQNLHDIMTYKGGWSKNSQMPRRYTQAAVFKMLDRMKNK